MYGSADDAPGTDHPLACTIYEVPNGKNDATPQVGADYRVPQQVLGRAGVPNIELYKVPGVPGMSAPVDYAEPDQYSGAVDEATYAELGAPLVYASVPAAAKPTEQQYDAVGMMHGVPSGVQLGAGNGNAAAGMYDIATSDAIDSAEPLYDVAETVAGDAADSAHPVMLDGYGNQCNDQAAVAAVALAAAA